MKNLKVAKRYAKALLLIAKEDGTVEETRKELGEFAELLTANPELETAIMNPVYESADRKKVLETVTAKAGLSKTVSAFLMLLFEKGRMGQIAAVNEVFGELADLEAGIARAYIRAAGDLSDEIKEKIREGLASRTGKEVVLKVEKDPALIGGLVTQIGDLVLDGSVRTQLQNLKESLKRSEAV